MRERNIRKLCQIIHVQRIHKTMTADSSAKQRKRFDRLDVRIPDGSSSTQLVDLIGIAGGQLSNSFFDAFVTKNRQPTKRDDAEAQRDECQRRMNSSALPQSCQTNDAGQTGRNHASARKRKHDRQQDTTRCTDEQNQTRINDSIEAGMTPLSRSGT